MRLGGREGLGELKKRQWVVRCGVFGLVLRYAGDGGDVDAVESVGSMRWRRIAELERSGSLQELLGW